MCPISEDAINQDCISLSIYFLDYGGHFDCSHPRRCAYAPTCNSTSHDNHETINLQFPFHSCIGRLLHLAALRAAGALLCKLSPVGSSFINKKIMLCTIPNPKNLSCFTSKFATLHFMKSVIFLRQVDPQRYPREIFILMRLVMMKRKDNSES